MSQAKVDKYKQEKANRKKIMKKEKRQYVLRVILACIVGLAFVGFLVWTVVDKYNEKNNETQQITLSEEEMSELMEQLTGTTSASEGNTTSANSDENASDENTSDENTSNEESASNEESSSDENTADEQDTTEVAE